MDDHAMSRLTEFIQVVFIRLLFFRTVSGTASAGLTNLSDE